MVLTHLAYFYCLFYEFLIHSKQKFHFISETLSSPIIGNVGSDT